MENFSKKMSLDRGKEKREKEPLVSIRLEFFRHSKQGPRIEGMQEYSRRLTEGEGGGRRTATEAGKKRNPKPEIGLSYASPRDRAQETSYRQLLSNQEEITDESSLEDIEGLVQGDLPVGSKMIIDERLNFNWNGSPEFNQESNKHFLKDKDTLKFFVEESDNLVVDSKDEKSTSYSRAAANIAEIIKKYTGILPQWEKLVEIDKHRKGSEKKGYAEQDNEMQRFLGSHGATVENFLLKVIDKIEGREAVSKFIENLPDKNSFDYNDGYSVKLFSENGQLEIVVSYHDKSWSLPLELLNEIISDRENLDRSIRAE